MKKRAKKRIAMSVSEARQSFLQLVQDVANDAVEMVEITHRDLDEDVMLVSGKRVRAWRSRLTALESQLRAQAVGEPFRLIGSGTMTDDAEEFLAASRQKAAREAAAKLENL
ncbi:MAG TPA: hypothetical protein VFA43_00510 [Gemmatimonadaceae bacterium]|nr:hypothetical protein [Gemmatimonadaceae bacterium]